MIAIIILGLATWRLTSMLVREDGPYHAFARLRRVMGTDRPGELSPTAELFLCLWCMSIWVATVLYVTARRAPGVLAILAASTVAITIDDARATDN